jgi:fibronectin-binding autotransporter adhesin
MSYRSIIAAMLTATAALAGPRLYAQTAYTFTATSGGAQVWNDAANWSPAGIPGTTPGDTANLGVALAASLDLDLGATDVTIGGLTLGGTASGVTTNLVGTGGRLILSNSAGDAPVVSGGVAGSVNTISTDFVLGGGVIFDPTSTQDIALTGNIGQLGGNRTLYNSMTGGQTLTIGEVGSVIQLYDANDPATSRNFAIKVFKDNAGLTPINTVVNAVWDNGSTSGNIEFGQSNQNPNAFFYMNPTQPSGASIVLGRQVYVMGADNALGTGSLRYNANNSNTWGGEIRTTDDAIVMGNSAINLQHAFSFGGDHSITVTGRIYQTNNRALGNVVAEGKTVYLTGTESTPAIEITGTSDQRQFIVDGFGTTIISGQVVNSLFDAAAIGDFYKRGSGRLELNNGTNTINGSIQSQGGLLVFGAEGAWGTTTGILAKESGGIAYTPGTGDAGFATLVSKIDPTSTGFLAIGSADAATNLDFTGGLANAANMSVGGDGNITYTGTVTPNPATGYAWGGLGGTITLGTNASVGANNVTVKNGGTVAVTGSQSYTGTTTVQSAVMATAQRLIALRTGNRSTLENQTFVSTLEVSSLANGGVASGLGASSADAANLLLDGGAVRVNSATATSTDRLFTITTKGGQLESSGAGAATFANTGSAVVAGDGARTFTLAGSSSAANTLASKLSDGAVQYVDVLNVAKSGSGKWVLTADNDYTGTTTVSGGELFINGSQLNYANYTAQAGGALGGSGTIGGTTTIQSGGTLSPGDGVGALATTLGITWASGSNVNWQINDATGTAGSGWDLLNATSGITLEGTSADPIKVNLWTLSGTENGSAANFNWATPYSWTFASADFISGFDATGFEVVTAASNGTSGFANPFGGGTFAVAQSGNDLQIVYTPGSAPVTDLVLNVASGSQTQAQLGYPTIASANSVEKTGAGTLVFDASNAYTGPTTVSAGTLQIANANAVGSSNVTVDTGATLAIASGTTMKSPSVIVDGGTLSGSAVAVNNTTGIAALAINAGTIAGSPTVTVGPGGQMSLVQDARVTVSVGGLSVDQAGGGGRLDLGAGQVSIAAGGITAADLRADIIAGRNGGAWNGTTGITSSTAASAGGTRAVGYVVSGDGSAKVSYSAAGDVDLSGAVNVFDLVSINSSGKYGSGTSSVWNQGDFNYDGVTNVFDLVGVNTAGAYGQGNYFPAAPSATGLGGAAAVPEPGTWALLAVAAAGLAKARRRRG